MEPARTGSEDTRTTLGYLPGQPCGQGSANYPNITRNKESGPKLRNNAADPDAPSSVIRRRDNVPASLVASEASVVRPAAKALATPIHGFYPGLCLTPFDGRPLALNLSGAASPITDGSLVMGPLEARSGSLLPHFRRPSVDPRTIG